MSHREQTPLQLKCYEIIFGTETPAGKWFDLALIAIIIASVIVIMLDSIVSLDAPYGDLFFRLEWLFTLMLRSSTRRASGVRPTGARMY